MIRYDYKHNIHLFFDTDKSTDYMNIYFTFHEFFPTFTKFVPIDNKNDISIINPLETGPEYHREPTMIFLNVQKYPDNEPQFVYQLAHELCHYSIRTGIKNENLKWFEETICTISSFFFLKKMAEFYAAEQNTHKVQLFTSYLTLNMNPTIQEQFPINFNIQMDRYDRPKINYLASILLPIFEEHPQLWNEIPRLADIEADDFESLIHKFCTNDSPNLSKPFSDLLSMFSV